MRREDGGDLLHRSWRHQEMQPLPENMASNKERGRSTSKRLSSHPLISCRIPLAKANSHLADVGGWIMQSEVSFLGHRAERGKTEKRTKDEEGGTGAKEEQVS